MNRLEKELLKTVFDTLDDEILKLKRTEKQINSVIDEFVKCNDDSFTENERERLYALLQGLLSRGYKNGIDTALNVTQEVKIYDTYPIVEHDTDN